MEDVILGTGTGIWAIDFADEFPEARIRGVDLSPTQPEWVPENVLFEIDDLEQTWNFTSPFDYIHMRMMLGSIANWPKLIKQAYENLAPGGWLESQEVLTHAYCDDGTLPPDCNWKKWEKLYVDAARSFGRPIDIAMELKGWYEEAGFVDIVEDVVKCPLGNWPADRGQKENGRYLRTSLSEGLQALSLAVFTRVLNWKPDEVEALIALCRNDLINRSYHGYFKFYFVRGRKPFPKPIQAPPPAAPSQAPTQTPRYDDFDFRSSTSTLGSTSGSGSTVTTSDRIFTEYQPMGFQPPNPVAAPPPPMGFQPPNPVAVPPPPMGFQPPNPVAVPPLPPPPPSAPAPSIVAPMNEPYMERRSMDFTAVERQPAEPRPMDLAPTDRTLTERRSMDYSPMDRTPVERRSMDLAPTDRPSIEQLPVNPPPAQRPPAERRSMDIPPFDRRPFDFSRP
ncbi:hypothetical protein Dda_5904 [Drechslerella dactyloides]|uniref:TAM domain methyltransferase n=1 Tax=Drechslerella dactyloides TaxID=74499 RepID=A0AAD6IUM1_DREDA|nr:hypothetical protein Dda_5904 [Drechslerella dactyloides]